MLPPSIGLLLPIWPIVWFLFFDTPDRRLVEVPNALPNFLRKVALDCTPPPLESSGMERQGQYRLGLLEYARFFELRPQLISYKAPDLLLTVVLQLVQQRLYLSVFLKIKQGHCPRNRHMSVEFFPQYIFIIQMVIRLRQRHLTSKANPFFHAP